MGFAHGFYVANAAVKDAFDQYEKAQIKNGVADIMNTLPDGSKIKPEEPGMMQKIGDFITGSETPQQQAGDPSKFTSDEISKYQTNGLANFFSAKGDPEKAFKIKQDAIQTEANQRKLNDLNRDDAYKKDMISVSGELPVFKGMQNYQQQTNQYTQQMADREAKIKAGATPDSLGAEPVKPSMPNFTAIDHLNTQTGMLEVKAKHGLLTPEDVKGLNDTYKSITKEADTKVFALLDQGADRASIAKAFNDRGTQFDVKNIVDYKPVTLADGTTTHEITVKNPDGTLQTYNGRQGLRSLQSADELLKSYYKDKEINNETIKASAYAAAQGASAAHSNASAEQNRVETQYMRENGFKMPTGREGGGQLTANAKYSLIQNMFPEKDEYGAVNTENVARKVAAIKFLDKNPNAPASMAYEAAHMPDGKTGTIRK